MTPYFSIISGETNLTNALKDRGLLGAWQAKLAAAPTATPYNVRLEWKAGDFVATAVRFVRSKGTLHAIVLTNTASEDMAAWHKEALKTLDTAAAEGPFQFDVAVQELTVGKA